MYSNSNRLLALAQHSGYLIGELTQALTNRGIVVNRSFDLQSTRAVHTGCGCPYHGTSQCTCQLIVLLIYQLQQPPLTLALEGRDGLTWVSVVHVPGETTDTHLVTLIVESLQLAASKAEMVDATYK
ncbi:MAG: hypothetical protein PHQ40_20110 [Anaerolineaceae bacterium]|nr:hypothetical protein [Anaerolineaceae bacterium]